MMKKIYLALLCLFTLTVVGCNNTVANVTNGDQHITEEMHNVITDFIVERFRDSYSPTEQQFEVHKIYGTSEENGDLKVYMWSYYSGFNRATGVQSQAGHSLPAAITLKYDGGRYTVVGYEEPLDGSYWLSSLEEMFPKKYVKKAIRDSRNAGGLHGKMTEKVTQWLNEN